MPTPRAPICATALRMLGRSPVAFVDRNGIGFAEAHHVIPVSQGKPGSLSHLNIMVLCPNHHRQAHHGRFEIEQNEPDYWQIMLDGNSIRIDKPMYPAPQPLDRSRTDGSALLPDTECIVQAVDRVDRQPAAPIQHFGGARAGAKNAF